MDQTTPDLPAHTRADVRELLNTRLAGRMDRMPQAKQAHWNVKGPSFMAIHRLFDEVIDAAESSMDLLAERGVQLGGTAEGTIQVVTTCTGLQAYPLMLVEERGHVEALSSALVASGRRWPRTTAPSNPRCNVSWRSVWAPPPLRLTVLSQIFVRRRFGVSYLCLKANVSPGR